MTIIDHLLIGVLFIGFPVYAGLYGWPSMQRACATGLASERIKLYWWTALPQWVLTATLVLLWIFDERSFGELGFDVQVTTGAIVGMVVVVALAILMVMNQVRVLATEKGRADTMKVLKDRAPFMPRSRREMPHFSMLAVTAGFCEELLYRAFVLWYAFELVGDSAAAMAGAVVVSSLVFGISHLYQGVAGAAQITAVGLLTATLYLLSGSLWVVVIFHTFLDLNAGLVSLKLFQGMPKSTSGEPEATQTAEPAGNS